MMLARVFADAAGLWKRDRDLWVRVAGFCFFVPALANMLFVPWLDLRGLSQDAAQTQMLAWLGANAWWLGLLAIWQIYSIGIVLALLLSPKTPTLASAVVRAARMLPGLALAYLGAMLLVGIGITLFIAPGLYMLGRTFLVLPILVAEPERGPIGALIAAIQRSHRRGWMLFMLPAGILLAENVIGVPIDALGDLLGAATSDGPARFVFGSAMALAAAAGSLVFALLQAAAYRELSGARQGI